MTQQSYTPDQLHQAFYNFLMRKFENDEEEANRIIEAAELTIPDTLREYFGASCPSIYDLQDADEIEDYRRKIKAHPVLKSVERRIDPRYTDVLKWYRLFRNALNANSIPVPVPGEYQKPDDEGQRCQVSDVTVPQVVKSTIFVEGEAEESQPKEIRLRNQQLRQACIEYFRALHGGHLVCECCGFEFRQAYDIPDDYIEVHHRTPFSHTEGEHPVNSQTDLVPLCANCHRMIHHGQGGKGNCMSLEELKAKYKGIKYNY